MYLIRLFLAVFTTVGIEELHFSVLYFVSMSFSENNFISKFDVQTPITGSNYRIPSNVCALLVITPHPPNDLFPIHGHISIFDTFEPFTGEF